MRASPEGPAAPRLFREVGADPRFTLLEVAAAFAAERALADDG